MGTLVAGIKEIFATTKTTGSNVMLCGNDGTPDGHMTMANLASVLGVANDVTSGSANSFIISGKYFLRASVTDTPFHSNAESLLEVFAGSSINYYILQRVSSYGGFQDFYIRYSLNNGKSWSEWIGFVGNMPTFYKNYNNLSALADALGAKRLNVRFDGDKKYVCDLYISPDGKAYLQDGYAQNIAEFPVTVLI